MEVVISFFATLLHLHTINVHLCIVARKTKAESAKAKARAMELYLDTNMTRQEIADIVQVNTKTISRWVAEDEWDNMKTARTITQPQIIQAWYMQLKQLNDAIMKRPDGQRFPTAGEADAMTKISNNISKIEKTLNIGMYDTALREFADYLERADMEAAKKFMPFLLDFIKLKIAQLNGN